MLRRKVLFLIFICRQPVAFLIKTIPCFCDFFCYVAGILKLYLLGKMIKVFVPQTDFYLIICRKCYDEKTL